MSNNLWRHTLSLVAVLSVTYGGSFSIVPLSHAQVTASTGSSSLNTNVPPATNGVYTITGGIRPGGASGTNLFHSFDSFSLGQGQKAHFSNSGSTAGTYQAQVLGAASQTANIFARVTGSNASIIDGKIDTRSEFPQANLWFMNPNGITFNSHASLDIGGSAAFTTANVLYLRDKNGYQTRFDMKTAVDGTYGLGGSNNNIPGELHVNPVAAFGFLGQVTIANSDVSPAGITTNDSILSVDTGKVLALVAGDVTINGGQLSAPNGAVRITGVGPFDSPQPCNCSSYSSSYASSPIQVSSYVNVASSGTHAHTSLTTNDPEGQENPIPKSSFGSISIGQGSTEAVIDTASNGQIQLNGFTYQGTSNTGWIASNGQPVKLEIIDGILVANLPPTQLIVSSPAVKSLSPDTTLDVGGNGPLTVTLNHAFIKDVAVQVKSDDANVASVTPAAVTVPAGSNSAPVTPGVRGVAPGTTSVKASAGATVPASALVNVTFPSSSVAPNPSTLTEGDGGTLIVTLVRPALENVTVIFTSSNPSVLKAPDPVQIPAQQASSIPVQFSTLQSGSATITASLQVASRPVGNTVSAPIQVHTVPLTSLAPNLSIIEANNGNLIVTLAKQPPHPVTVTFASSNPDAVPAPAPIIISPNQTSGAVTVQAQHPGATTITASYGTGTVSAPVVVTPPPITTFAPNLTVSSNTTGTVTITLAAPSSRDVRVVLDSSNTGVATLDPFVTIPAGQKSVTAPVHGLAAGTATIRASEGNSTASANVQVLDASLSNSVAAGKIVNPLRTQTIPVSYATQLIMASDRCVGGKNGEFSSFVKRGRDAAPLQPGGMLPSPLGLEDKTPKISTLSRFPSSVVTRGLGTLNLASGVAVFLQRDTGC